MLAKAIEVCDAKIASNEHCIGYWVTRIEPERELTGLRLRTDQGRTLICYAKDKRSSPGE